MKNIGRTIRVGIVVWLIFFGWYLHEFYDINWRFNLFSGKHWAYIWNEFRDGWTISTKSDWIFILTVLWMVPFFILLWWWACKVSWRKTLKMIFVKIKNIFFKPTPKKVIKKKIAVKAKDSHKHIRPVPMANGGRPVAKQIGKTMDAGQEASLYTPPAPQQSIPMDSEQTPLLDEETSQIPLDEIKLPDRVQLKEDLVAILSEANYQIVKDVTLGKRLLSFVGISADKIVLCLTDTEKGDWLADEELFNGEDPLWFSESAHRVSPVFQLLQEAKKFSQKLLKAGLDQAIFPVVIIKEGNIINATDISETWKKIGVIVCRTDLGGPEDLPSFSTALPKASDKGTEDTLNQVRNLF